MASDKFKESEHLFYTQGVTGSSPVLPTTFHQIHQRDTGLGGRSGWPYYVQGACGGTGRAPYSDEADHEGDGRSESYYRGIDDLVKKEKGNENPIQGTQYRNPILY